MGGMERRVTIEEVASRAGVSMATVSRALRGLPNVSPATRARVLTVAEALHYRPNPNASRLARGKTHTVAMAVLSPSLWYTGQVIAGAEAVLSASGYDLALLTISSPEVRHRLLGEPSSLASRVDGLVLVDTVPEIDRPRSMPIVTVGAESPRLDCAVIDNYAGAAAAARHLLELGHDEVALIGGDPDAGPDTSQGSRRQGFLETLAAGGVEVPERRIVNGGFSVVGGYEAMGELLAAERFTAVFAMSDEMAMGAMRAAREAGVRIPEDVSMVGFDGHDLAFTVGLTTVHQDPELLGCEGARLLLERLDEPGGERVRLEIPTRLVVRDSTRVAKNEPAQAGSEEDGDVPL